MSRGVIVGLLGVVVLGAVIGIYFGVVKTTDSGGNMPATQTSSPSSTSSTTTTGPAGDTPAPSLPSAGGTTVAVAPEGQNPKDYVVGDIRVHDHRTGDNKPLDIPPNVHPADSREIPATLTQSVSHGVQTVMATCAKDSLPQDARGTKPRLEGQISIDIKDHNVTIKKATMQVRDVNGPAVDAMKSCMESKSIGLTTAAPDQQDLEDYTINLSFAIP